MPEAARYRRQVQAVRDGDTVRLRLLRSPAARAVVADHAAPQLDRLLAASAAGLLPPALVGSVIEQTPDLRQAVLALGDQAQAGDIAIGQAAGRDIVTINVYVGERGER